MLWEWTVGLLAGLVVVARRTCALHIYQCLDIMNVHQCTPSVAPTAPTSLSSRPTGFRSFHFAALR